MDDLIAKAARAIYDAPDTQSGDCVGTVIWLSEHLFYDDAPDIPVKDKAWKACEPVCTDAAKAAFAVFQPALATARAEAEALQARVEGLTQERDFHRESAELQAEQAAALRGEVEALRAENARLKRDMSAAEYYIQQHKDGGFNGG